MTMHQGSTPPQSPQSVHRCSSAFREGRYRCLRHQADELFELTDALLCPEGKNTDLADLSLEPEHYRGCMSLFDALHEGELNLTASWSSSARFRYPRSPTSLAVSTLCWRPTSGTGCAPTPSAVPNASASNASRGKRDPRNRIRRVVWKSNVSSYPFWPDRCRLANHIGARR